ncbi:MAG: hypothetical protein LWX83_09580 [Anaerolineae bacterium]|nr:hypothetical protein [Anaerolineae bacterium]
MSNFPPGSRETYLSQIAAKIYANADESFHKYQTKNPQKTLANYVYSLVVDSPEYANHEITERELDIVIDRIMRMIKGRTF